MEKLGVRCAQWQPNCIQLHQVQMHNGRTNEWPDKAVKEEAQVGRGVVRIDAIENTVRSSLVLRHGPSVYPDTQC